jgi:hypothetical protein
MEVTKDENLLLEPINFEQLTRLIGRKQLTPTLTQ